MRDKFTAGSGPTFAVGSEGGSETHTHDFTTDGHKHSIPENATLNSGMDYYFETSTDSITGTSAATANLPKYYALAYIMFLGT